MDQGYSIPGQFLNEPVVANVAMRYGQALVGSGKQLVDRELEKYVSVSRLKYYFAVDTKYVTKKLGLLFFPFTHSVSSKVKAVFVMFRPMSVVSLPPQMNS
jgi:hypothetical protein